MNPPKVSIIIPVYNTEEYLEETISTIMNQSLMDLEIIIVNDGSTDGSDDIIKNIASSDYRIKVIEQPNGGLSVARNSGTSAANGKYIYFMDSDDLLELDAMELCYAQCERDNLDFVLFDAECFKKDNSSLYWVDYYRTKYLENKIYSGIELLNFLIGIKKYRASVCLNFIRSSFIEENKISFYPGILHEDELYTALLYIQARKVGKIERTFFKRRIREGSIMSKGFSPKNIDSYLIIASELKIFGKDKDSYVKNSIDKVIRFILNPAVLNSWSLPSPKRWTIFTTVICKYLNLISCYNLVILLFKYPINKLKKI